MEKIEGNGLTLDDVNLIINNMEAQCLEEGKYFKVGISIDDEGLYKVDMEVYERENGGLYNE